MFGRYLILVATLTLTLPVFGESVFYRYPGANGDIVIDDKVPPEAIPRGYDVIRADGSIVKTVAPELSAQERRVWEQEQAITEARAEAEAKMRKWDESLMLRYSDLNDIEVAKQRALTNIRVRISILKSNLAVVKQQVLKNQADAAEMERQGRSVPEELLDTIRDLRLEVEATEGQIARRTEEIDEVAENYERDKARFAKLLGSVKLRRQQLDAEGRR